MEQDTFRENRWFHFLRNFPAWIVLSLFLAIFLGLYHLTGDVAYKDWISWFVSALFTSLGMQRFVLPNYYPTGQTASFNNSKVIIENDGNDLPDSTDLNNIQPEEIKFDDIEKR